MSSPKSFRQFKQVSHPKNAKIVFRLFFRKLWRNLKLLIFHFIHDTNLISEPWKALKRRCAYKSEFIGFRQRD